MSPIQTLRVKPTRTIQDRAAREEQFRRATNARYDMIHIGSEPDSGLRAVIKGLFHPVNPNEEEALCRRLRNEISIYCRTHPDIYTQFLASKGIEHPEIIRSAHLSYCQRILDPRERIGNMELKLLSEILNFTLEIHSFENILEHGKALDGSQKRTIHLYYDPLLLDYTLINKNNN